MNSMAIVDSDTFNVLYCAPAVVEDYRVSMYRGYTVVNLGIFYNYIRV